MKTKLFTLLAAAAACGFAGAETTTAYTTPVGYTTQSLAANTFNLVGINVLKPTLVQSTLTAVSGAVITDTTKDFTTLLTTGKTYIVEIAGGPGTADGGVEWFTMSGDNTTATTITLPATENIAGAAVGDTYTIRLAPTVQELFPVGLLNSFALTNVTSADKVWVPQGNGTYLRYAYKTGTNVGWHITPDGSVDGGLVTADIPVVTSDGLLVEKKATAKELVVSGEVKKTTTNVYVLPGFNLISINPPVGATLFTSGLNGDLATYALTNVTSADKVWIPQGNGTYLKYAVKTGSNAGWHITADGSVDGGLVTVDVPLPASIYIQRAVGSAKLMTLDVPSGYSNL